MQNNRPQGNANRLPANAGAYKDGNDAEVIQGIARTSPLAVRLCTS